MSEVFTIKKITFSHFSDKGSKFTGYIHPILTLDKYRKSLSDYKDDNPKACHVCSAYRIDIGGRIDEYASDDGEPSGSAGQPILGVLKRNKLVNAAIYVIRIYGGVNLGIPGLINAYATTAEKTLDYANKINWIDMDDISINYGYEHVKIIESLVSKYSAKIQEQKFDNTIKTVIQLPKSNKKLFESDLVKMTNGNISIN